MDEALLVAEFYEAVFTTPLETFKETILARLTQAIPFDAAVWASGVNKTRTIFSVVLHDFPHAALADYVMNWQEADFVRAAAVADPGRAYRNEDVMALADYHRSDIYRHYSAPAGIEHALGTTDVDPVTTLGEIFFLFRADAARPFSDLERDLQSRLIHHLTRAWRHRQLLAAHGGGNGGGGAPGHAAIDDQGHIHAADDRFTAIISRAFPDWRGPTLPDQLQTIIGSSAGEGRCGALFVRAVRSGGRSLVTIDESALARLSPAELRTARLFAEGRTTGEIARANGLSASTVRDQLAAAYAKLEVSSKIELVRLLD